jgi:hypothetical protein
MLCCAFAFWSLGSGLVSSQNLNSIIKAYMLHYLTWRAADACCCCCLKHKEIASNRKSPKPKLVVVLKLCCHMWGVAGCSRITFWCLKHWSALSFLLLLTLGLKLFFFSILSDLLECGIVYPINCFYLTHAGSVYNMALLTYYCLLQLCIRYVFTSLFFSKSLLLVALPVTFSHFPDLLGLYSKIQLQEKYAMRNLDLCRNSHTELMQ